MNNLLFVYGTLLNKDNEYAIYLKSNSKFYAEGRLKGRLYDAGEYPGAVLSSGSDDDIDGVILQLNNSGAVLSVLDDYEGFGPEHPYPNEFIRVSTDIETGAGAVTCWVYLYNLPVTGLLWLKNGRHIK